MKNAEKIGSGARYRGLAAKLAKNRKVKNPRALAAWIGQEKYGKQRMQQLAKRGRERAADRAAEREENPDAPPKVRRRRRL